jgi:hypothetical protein
MRFYRHASQMLYAEFFGSTACAARLVTTAVLLASMVWLSARAYSACASGSPGPTMENISPDGELAWSPGFEGGQVASFGDVKINIEAYNRKREKDIANASKKLLSLAIALKSDLDHDPDSDPSPSAMSKAREIEKLAHDVKETMKLNLISPH